MDNIGKIWYTIPSTATGGSMGFFETGEVRREQPPWWGLRHELLAAIVMIVAFLLASVVVIIKGPVWIFYSLMAIAGVAVSAGVFLINRPR